MSVQAKHQRQWTLRKQLNRPSRSRRRTFKAVFIGDTLRRKRHTFTQNGERWHTCSTGKQQRGKKRVESRGDAVV